jgi:hypothetical protein
MNGGQEKNKVNENLGATIPRTDCGRSIATGECDIFKVFW